MAKQKKQLDYVYATDPNEFNLRFYQRYDENFLYNKALTLAVVLANAERFKAQVAEYQDIDPNRVDDKFFESLQAELHFTEMHQFEGFFALLTAVFQKQPDWIYLTEYTTWEMKDAIKLFIAGHSHIKTLSNNKVATEREFISNAVYASYMPQSEEKNDDSWNANLDNIAWLIRHMAERYIAGSEYNAYKHGLRVMTGQSSFGLRLENPPGTPVGPLRILASSKDSLSYLEVKEQVMLLPQDYQTQQENEMEQSSAAQSGGARQSEEEKKQIKVKRVYETTKHFNPQESLTYLSIMNRLLTTVKRTRLAYFDDGVVLEGLANFSNLDKDQLLALGAQSHFQTSFSV